jgi:glyoxylase-like metal-dependent hydrolase (beta-lactamase superfamily II)
VQREEIRYAVAPLPTHAVTYETPIIGMKPYWLEIPRFELVEGDAEIVKDVSVIHTPSQTPGYQSVVVNTTAGTQVIAGCMVPLYENWGSSRLGTHIVGLDPFSLDAYWKSFQKIESLADVVFPGHDPEVLRRHGNGI